MEAEPKSVSTSTGSIDASLLSDEAVVLDSDCLPSQDVEIASQNVEIEVAEDIISSQALTQLFIRICLNVILQFGLSSLCLMKNKN